jgi:ATP-dependent RNA helicase DDX31/DBP7
MKSETGSGKTLAYLVPLIEYLSVKSLTEEKISRENGTYCIIISPTRELCLQIEIELKKLLKLFFYIVPGVIIGGEQVNKEKSRLRKGLGIVICTPGRFLYHLQNTTSLNLSRLSYLIFDEADRILDMGFEREMN